MNTAGKNQWFQIVGGAARRVWFLYLILTVVLAFLIDYRQVQVNRLNFLRQNIGQDLIAFQKGFEVSRQTFRLGERYYRMLMRHTGPSPLLYNNIGFCCYYQKKTGEALAALTEAYRLEPRYYAFGWNLGMMAFNNRQYSEAIRYLQDGISLIPSAMRWYQKRKREQAGAPDIERLIFLLERRAWKDEEVAFHVLAQSHHATGDIGVMLPVALEGLRRYPDSLRLLYDVGLAYYEFRQYRQAARFFERIIAADPNDVRAYQYHLLCMEALSDQSRIREDRQRLLKLEERGAGVPDRYAPEQPLHLAAEMLSIGLSR